MLDLLYTSDISELEHDAIVTFADDTAIMAVGKGYEEVEINSKTSAFQIDNWIKQWRIKLGELKSAHANITNIRTLETNIFLFA